MAKFALCIGINDYGSDVDNLHGAINDAKDWHVELEKRGFDVRSLLNDEATKAEILKRVRTLIAEAVKGDSVVITFSGHGIYVRDDEIKIEGEVGEEADFRDEALCPFDTHDNVILDDEVYELFEPTKDGVELVFIADCCSSGTIAERLAGPNSMSGEYVEEEAESDADSPEKSRRLESTLTEKAREAARSASARTADQSGTSKALLLSACEDGDRRAKEKKRNGRWNGAYTRAALDVLPQNPASYEAWHVLIIEKLKQRGFDQNPQIEGDYAQKVAPVLA